ncbi:NAD(P)-binding protein [bacterium]|nr:NAD(P)-binding protein [bacterium]
MTASPTSRDRPDVVVIGSGATGLAAAAMLAKAGCGVRVLEAHPELLGGHARTYTIDGYDFCAGPQYVWDFLGDGIGARVLRFLDIDEALPFAPMNAAGMERVVVGGREAFEAPRGLAAFRDAMSRSFPGETQAIDRVFGELIRLVPACRVLADRGLFDAGAARMAGAVLGSRDVPIASKFAAMRRLRATLDDLARGLSPAARRVLGGHEGIFLENARELSAGVFAAATGFYHESAARPVPGFARMIDALAGVVREAGGEVLAGVRAASLEIDGGRVRAVRTTDGTRYAADIVISNLSPRQTAALLPGGDKMRFAYEPSNTFLSAFVGVNGYPDAARDLAGKNLWWYPDDAEVDYTSCDMTATPRMLCGAIQGPKAGAQNTADAFSMVVFCPGNFAQAKAAAEAGDAAHDELRGRAGERILSALDGVFPGIRARVETFRVLSPWDVYTEIGAESGNGYGRRLTPKSVLAGARGLPAIDGLHVACATCGMPGIANAFRSAALLVQRLTGVRV